ncbi:C-glycoside deglycosidase beta subunit domain-containing protein [Luteimicrobium sp. DT211]|uniref:C-glycoside deglycosidase beta subunit domain-containing protein n=1 Tax=Luteimicrobium sp. DT211 TaxID=3393412 RepID=UPI003CF2D774
MPTSYMKLAYEDKVLRPGALTEIRLETGPVGFTLDVGLNYYRGLPLSAVERFELTVDGERVPDHQLLFELNDKLMPLSQLALAFTEFWSVKKDLRVHVYQGGLQAGDHDVALTMVLRCVYMQLAPGVWGQVDNSASRTLTLSEAA